MGVFYSTWYYLSSCYKGYGGENKLKSQKIQFSAMKLIFTLRHKQKKLQQQTKKLELKLLQKIISSDDKVNPISKRSLVAEQALMQQIVLNSQLLSAYQEIIRCSDLINHEANMLEKDISNISRDCEIAILTVIYAKNALNIQDIIQVNQFVPEKMQTYITLNQISEPLRQYVQNSGIATQRALNFYALEMCYRNNITLDKFLQVGHNFNYNPPEWGQRKTKSQQMFAIDLDDIEIPIQLQKQHIQEKRQNQYQRNAQKQQQEKNKQINMLDMQNKQQPIVNKQLNLTKNQNYRRTMIEQQQYDPKQRFAQGQR